MQIGNPTLVLFFHCPEEEAERRFLSRKLTGRESDDTQLFKKRYQEFSKQNRSILDYYRTRGILIEASSSRHSNHTASTDILEIDTSGETETSYRTLMAVLEEEEEWISLRK
jgi:adenylate kinase family enzyme